MVNSAASFVADAGGEQIHRCAIIDFLTVVSWQYIETALCLPCVTVLLRTLRLCLQFLMAIEIRVV